MIQAL